MSVYKNSSNSVSKTVQGIKKISNTNVENLILYNIDNKYK